MQLKRYIGAIIFILSFLAVISEQEFNAPNQEIVLEFNHVEVTSNEAQTAVAQVKQQLYALGANQIKVQQTVNGKLKITYYSDADIASIKKIFAKDLEHNLDSNAFSKKKKQAELPSEAPNIAYNIDVFEIQNSNNTGLGFDGKCVLTTDTKSDRFSDPNAFFFIEVVNVSIEKHTVKTAYKVRRNISISTENNLHKIPEGRAGPTC
ncbi:hypothetical protein [Algibacter sp. L1A34]|uniref:hypothetical protein n=1 Tax=Algibacter sp. L1A34 TaxID=2686365 RepID=UPI00131D079D|nr:hypothetical protein [Algibacter sp. L1A34]